MSRLLTRIYIKYQSSVNFEELNQRVLKLSQTMEDDSVKKTEVYRLPNNPNLETVLHCMGVYKTKALNIDFDGEDLFTNFGQVLEGEDYDNYTRARAEGNQESVEDFDACMRRFVLNYCRPDTKKNQYNDFITNPINYKKPLKKEIRPHANCLLSIQAAINHLPPANRYNLTANHVKETLIASTPWKTEFVVSCKNLETMTHQEVVKWLEDVKERKDEEFAEQQAAKKRGRDNDNDNDNVQENLEAQQRRINNQDERDRGRGRGRGRRGNRFQGRQPRQDANEVPCNKHEGMHLWKDCPFNWYSPNYGKECVPPTNPDYIPPNHSSDGYGRSNYSPYHSNDGCGGRGPRGGPGNGGGRFQGRFGRDGRGFNRASRYGGPPHAPQQQSEQMFTNHFTNDYFNHDGINRECLVNGPAHGISQGPNDQRAISAYFNDAFKCHDDERRIEWR